jgi:PAS domain S-box-containing protein
MRWTEVLNAGFLSTLKDEDVEISVEYMDTKRFGMDAIPLLLEELFRIKYFHKVPDIVVVADNNALSFVREKGEELFPDIPVVFCGINFYSENMVEGMDEVTGVAENLDIRGTIDMMLEIHPKLENIFVVRDGTPTSNVIWMEVAPIFAEYPEINFLYEINPTLAELQAAISRLPEKSAVLHTSFYRDANGRALSAGQSIGAILESSDAPVYVLHDSIVRLGCVGGVVVDGFSQGAAAGGLVKKILGGTPASTLPVLRKARTAVMNYPAMKRFGISKGDLPEDVVIINEPTTIYHRYKGIIFITAGFIILQSIVILGFIIMNKRKKRAERALEKSEMRCRKIVESSPLPMAVVDIYGNIFFVNKKYTETLGYSCKEIPKMSDLRKRIHPEALYRKKVRKKWHAAVHRAHNEGTFEPQRWEVLCKDGSEKILEVMYEPMGDQGLVIFNDITKRDAMERDLIKAKEEAESANRFKDEFLANVSHEIRTPLNGIMGMLQLALDGPLEKELEENLQTALHSSESLLAVIKDILDVSMIEAGKLELRSEEFHPVQLLESICSIFRVQAAGKGIALKQDIHPNVPETLRGDAGRLRQILFNLIGNSIKFTEQGHVAVTLSTMQRDDQSFWLSMEIADTGIGIPENKMGTIFEPFTQVDGSYTRRHQGTGLGLNIVKRLVDLMEGFVDVQSSVGEGTRFNILVGIEQGEQYEGALEEDRAEAPQQLKILLAEDNIVNQTFALRMLQKRGHEVTCVGNGEEAVSAVQGECFDIVLMDIQMPVLDGIEAVKRIRSGEHGKCLPDIPIIALTAHTMKGDKERFLAAGMNDFIAKPVDIDHLMQKINIHCSAAAGIDGARRAPQSSTGVTIG